MSGLPFAESCRGLLAPALRSDDRVLVLGAGGWFGSTSLAMLDGVVPQSRVLALASEPRDQLVAGVPWRLQTWDAALAGSFAPTVVLNFAFLTRGFAATLPAEQYRATNARLTARFLEAARLPTVRTALTVSSGAAVTEPEHAYGRMKLAEEAEALALVTPGRSVVVARAYSVSGPFARHPREYAFSSFVEQAMHGRIAVMADRPTFRRYCDVGQYLAVSIRRALDGWSGVIESGGELVEMGELAQLVADACPHPVAVTRAEQVSEAPSVYASDDSDWREHCAALALEPATLAAQVTAAVSRESHAN